MSYRFLLLILLAMVSSSCQKDHEPETCRLVKFVQENPLNKSFHYDYISFKDKRIEKLLSFDIDFNKDTLNKVVAFFEYNEKGKVKAIRDESDITRIRRYEGVFDSNSNVAKIIQKANGDIEDEISIEYDSKKRPVSISSRYLLGISRSIEYDANGNPYIVFRSDLSAPPSITENAFDTKRNFFSGIPEIQFYWLCRPLNSFLPFGDNNIISSKVLVFEGTSFKESESQKTTRELVYNEKGFPDFIKITRNDLSNTVTNISSFTYNCE